MENAPIENVPKPKKKIKKIISNLFVKTYIRKNYKNIYQGIATELGNRS